MVRSSHVTVGVTATVLAGEDSDGQSVLAHNMGSTSIFVGGADVTTSNGFEVAAGVSISIDLASGEGLYAVTASATDVVHVLRTRAS